MLTVNSGRDYKYLDKGDVPVYGTGGYMTSVNDKISDEDGIGLGRKGTINKPFFIKAPFWTVDTLFFLIPQDNNQIKFILPLVQRRNWEKLNEATGVPSLSKKTIENVLDYFPEQGEQIKIGKLIESIENTIALYQEQLELYKTLKTAMLQQLFPSDGETNPKVRFTDFHENWKRHKLKEVYEKRTERNPAISDKPKIISVANMYFKSDVNTKNPEYLLTYNIMKIGDIAYEGNKSKKFMFGRFVENTIGDGIVSHVFTVFKNISKYDLYFWKYYINYEPIMRKVLVKSTSKATMMNNLVTRDFLNQFITFPDPDEQRALGSMIQKIDELYENHKCSLNMQNDIKDFFLQKLFI